MVLGGQTMMILNVVLSLWTFFLPLCLCWCSLGCRWCWVVGGERTPPSLCPAWTPPWSPCPTTMTLPRETTTNWRHRHRRSFRQSTKIIYAGLLVNTCGIFITYRARHSWCALRMSSSHICFGKSCANCMKITKEIYINICHTNELGMVLLCIWDAIVAYSYKL